MTDTPTPTFWARQRERLTALRELYREHGVLVLSPTVLRLVQRRAELETEVRELRGKTMQAVERLDVNNARYREAQLEAIKNPLVLDNPEN